MPEHRQNNTGSQPKNHELSSIFLDDIHQSRFAQHLGQLNEYQQASTEYQAALFILTSTDELYQKTTPYFSTDGFRHLAMFKEQDFSSGYALMTKAAANLFGFYEYELSLADLVSTADEEMFPVLIQALIIRKHGL